MKVLVCLFTTAFGLQAAAIDCPETLLRDFGAKVTSRGQAEELLRRYFSEGNGFPKFDPSKVQVDDSPSCSGSATRKSTCYFYFDWYGLGPSGAGGYLYFDGRLVKRGYCK